MRNGGQVSICDCCGKSILPFNTIRVVTRTLVKGNNYKNCSSDTKTRDIMTRHFCKNCSEKVEEILKNLCKESEDTSCN